MKKFTKLALGLALGLSFANVAVVQSQTTVNFTYTGSVQTFTVPCGVDSVLIDMAGAQGGNNSYSGGNGGRVQCTYYTTGGTVFNIYVGGQGAAGASLAAGGYNGGGSAGMSNGGSGSTGSGGGGATDIRVGGTALANRVIVAGGGGGANNYNGPPGAGGDTVAGSSPNDGNTCFASFATGGTQTAGGIDAICSGTCCLFTPTPNGSLGLGGNGAGPSTSCNNGDGGAGGGGGYYGGGGGGGYGSGGGGSSYTDVNCGYVVHTLGYQAGNGYLNITYYGGSKLNLTMKTISNVNCFGGNNGKAVVIPSGGLGTYTYAWSPFGGNKDTASVLTAGTYTVNVIDSTGCTGKDSVTITQPTQLVVTTDSMVGVSCNGGSNGKIGGDATGGTSPYNYAWSNSATSMDIMGLTAATYTLTVTDKNGCVVTASGTVTQPAPLTVSIDSSIHPPCDDSLWAIVGGGTIPYSYMWSTGGTKDSLTGLCSGKYSVVVMDKNGCKDSAMINIVVAGIDNLVSNDGIRVYPVPASGSLTIDLDNSSFNVSAISIYDVTGRKISDVKTSMNSRHLTLDVSKLDNGIYFLRLIGNGGSENIRFEISR
jgi:hypothetical protein